MDNTSDNEFAQLRSRSFKANERLDAIEKRMEALEGSATAQNSGGGRPGAVMLACGHDAGVFCDDDGWRTCRDCGAPQSREER